MPSRQVYEGIRRVRSTLIHKRLNINSRQYSTATLQLLSLITPLNLSRNNSQRLVDRAFNKTMVGLTEIIYT